MVVGFYAEDIAFVVAGECGWVEDDAVEGAALLSEAAEPVEGVAFAEVVWGGVDVVCSEIIFCPIEVGL